MLIDEPFDDEQALYYYTDISTALQMNDGQMKVFAIQIRGRVEKVSFIHYDLHCKNTKKVLYGVVGRNAPNPSIKHRDKWMWKIDGFMTADQIARRFGVGAHELPLSSRECATFQEQLFGPKSPITGLLIEETPWMKVQQIKSLKRGRNAKTTKIKIRITEREWKAAVKQSLSDELMPMVPVVVNRNNAHWIEWIKMVRVESFGVFVGISCRDLGAGDWSVQSIDLDSGRIYNKYRLVGLENEETDRRLRAMKTSSNITEIQFIRDHATPTVPMLVLPSDNMLKPPAPAPAAEEWIDQIVSDVLQKEQRFGVNQMYGHQGAYASGGGMQTVNNANPICFSSGMHSMQMNQQFVALPAMYVQPMCGTQPAPGGEGGAEGSGARRMQTARFTQQTTQLNQMQFGTTAQQAHHMAQTMGQPVYFQPVAFSATTGYVHGGFY